MHLYCFLCPEFSYSFPESHTKSLPNGSPYACPASSRLAPYAYDILSVSREFPGSLVLLGVWGGEVCRARQQARLHALALRALPHPSLLPFLPPSLAEALHHPGPSRGRVISGGCSGLSLHLPVVHKVGTKIPPLWGLLRIQVSSRMPSAWHMECPKYAAASFLWQGREGVS